MWRHQLAADKQTRKSLKEPDEFISFATKTVQWIIENRTSLIIGVLGITAIILAIIGFQWYVVNQEKAASEAFVAAKKTFDSPVVVPEEADSEAPSLEGSFSSDSDKYQAAITEFSQVKKKYDGTHTASLADYFIGECHLRLEDYDKAIKSFEEYLDKESTAGAFAMFAVEGIGISLEEQKKHSEAEMYYKKLSQPPLDFAPDRGLYHIARLEQKEGNIDKAKKLFEEILEKHPGTIFRPQIENRLSRLPKSVPEKKEEAPKKEEAKAPAKQDNKKEAKGAE
jgi:tetratricopeptide (TPR) repeat protein